VEDSDRQTAADGDHHDSPGAAFREAISQLGELREYAGDYIVARLDALKLSVRDAIIWLLLAILILLGVVCVVVTAIVIFCLGLAQMLAAALGGRMWAGNLIVGGVLIAAVVLTVRFGLKKMFDSSLAKTKGRYERKLRRERVELGHDAAERSTETEHD
jgi:hypothetical protein